MFTGLLVEAFRSMKFLYDKYMIETLNVLIQQKALIKIECIGFSTRCSPRPLFLLQKILNFLDMELSDQHLVH